MEFSAFPLWVRSVCNYKIAVRSVSFDRRGMVLSVPGIYSGGVKGDSCQCFLLTAPSFEGECVSPSLKAVRCALSLCSVFVTAGKLYRMRSAGVSSCLSLILYARVAGGELVPGVEVVLFRRFLKCFPSAVFHSFYVSYSFSGFVLDVGDAGFSRKCSVSCVFVERGAFVCVQQVLWLVTWAGS